MQDKLTSNLTALGMKEYEAKVYSAVVGLGEGSARQIHEVSGVPRPRVYDTAESLFNRGFLNVRRGNPHIYVPVEPAVVINRLRSSIESAATDALEKLDTLSLDARQKISPIWYVQGEWSIKRHLEALVEKVSEDLTVICMDYDDIDDFAPILSETSRNYSVKILFPNGKKGMTRMLGRSELFKPGEFCDFFQNNIYSNIFAGPVSSEGQNYELNYIFIADEKEYMIIYTLDGVRHAVVITLPFIICIQKQYMNKMTLHSEKIE